MFIEWIRIYSSSLCASFHHHYNHRIRHFFIWFWHVSGNPSTLSLHHRAGSNLTPPPPPFQTFSTKVSIVLLFRRNYYSFDNLQTTQYDLHTTTPTCLIQMQISRNPKNPIVTPLVPLHGTLPSLIRGMLMHPYLQKIDHHVKVTILHYIVFTNTINHPAFTKRCCIAC